MKIQSTSRPIVWCLLAALSSVRSLAATEVNFSGTWSGSFDIQFADGRVLNDTAWLVLHQSGLTVTGTVGPKAEEQGPLREGLVAGNELKFVADSTTGKVLQFVLRLEGERLSGEANGDIGDDHVRVVLNVTRNSIATAPPLDPMYQEMLALDTALFDSFNKCSDPTELKKHAAFFARDVEFYHDHDGLTKGADAMIGATRKNVCGKFRRELDLQTFRVFPLPGYGAMATGSHRFCHTPTTCEGAGEFTTIWREEDGVWHITRALSYAHRQLISAAAGLAEAQSSAASNSGPLAPVTFWIRTLRVEPALATALH